MTSKRAPRRRAASGPLSAALVLVLGAWVHPALSATDADTRCDQSIDTRPVAAPADARLSIQVIDHGASTAEELSLEGTSADLAPDFSDRRTGPRIDIILRRGIDVSQLPQSRLSEPAHPDSMSTPLGVDKTDAVEEPAAMINAGQRDDADELPEISADDFLRYRQQMFRKDI